MIRNMHRTGRKRLGSQETVRINEIHRGCQTKSELGPSQFPKPKSQQTKIRLQPTGTREAESHHKDDRKIPDSDETMIIMRIRRDCQAKLKSDANINSEPVNGAR